MSDSGINGAVALGTAEKGKIMIEGTIDRLIEVGRDFKDMPKVPRTDHRVSRRMIDPQNDRINPLGMPPGSKQQIEWPFAQSPDGAA